MNKFNEIIIELEKKKLNEFKEKRIELERQKLKRFKEEKLYRTEIEKKIIYQSFGKEFSKFF